jgi:uncharacterized protein (DUF2141 family)
MKVAALLIAGLAITGPAQAQVKSGVEFLPVPEDPPAYLFTPSPLAGTMLRPFAGPTPSTGADVLPEPGQGPVATVDTGTPAAHSPPAAPGAAVAELPPATQEAPPAAPPPPPAPTTGTVTVIVENVESNSGTVKVAVCDKGLSREGCPYSHEIPAAKGFVETEFDDIPPGTYAVVGYHDVNGNNEFDKLFGMPREPYALSSKAGEMLVPTFADAALHIGAGQNAVIIRLRRLGG